MKNLWSNKKLVIIVTVLLLIIGVALILSLTLKATKEPVIYEFNEQTGIVTFCVSSGYELYDIQLHYGRVKLPDYSANTETISFNVSELEEGKNEFFTFRCKKKNKNENELLNSVTYEVIRGPSELVILLYKGRFLRGTQHYPLYN